MRRGGRYAAAGCRVCHGAPALRPLPAFALRKLPPPYWIRFRPLEAVADTLAQVFFAAERRGVHLSWLAALASRCYAAARRTLEGE